MQQWSSVRDHPIFWCVQDRYLVGGGSFLDNWIAVLGPGFEIGAVKDHGSFELAREVTQFAAVDCVVIVSRHTGVR